MVVGMFLGMILGMIGLYALVHLRRAAEEWKAALMRKGARMQRNAMIDRGWQSPDWSDPSTYRLYEYQYPDS